MAKFVNVAWKAINLFSYLIDCSLPVSTHKHYLNRICHARAKLLNKEIQQICACFYRGCRKLHSMYSRYRSLLRIFNVETCQLFMITTEVASAMLWPKENILCSSNNPYFIIQISNGSGSLGPQYGHWSSSFGSSGTIVLVWLKLQEKASKLVHIKHK